MKYFLQGALIAAGAIILDSILSFAAPPGSEARPPDTLWQTDGFGKTTVVFIPATFLTGVIAGTPVLPSLPPEFAGKLRLRVQRSKLAAATGSPKCGVPLSGSVINDGQSSEVPSGLDALQVQPIVVVGTVERLVPGMTAAEQVATLVEIRVDRVMKGEFIVHSGDRITFMEGFGSVVIDGAEICVATPDYRLPRLGESILVGGHPDLTNTRNLDTRENFVFFVNRGVVDRGAREPENWRPITLRQLDETLNPGMSR